MKKELDYISAEEQIIQLQKQVGYDIKDYTLDYIVQEFQKDFFFIPEYQRNFIWPEKNKSRFVESLILGIPIPFLFVADTDDGHLEIVDGAQRIQTLEAFLNNDLKLKDLNKLTELNGFCFNDLPEAQRRKLKNRSLRMIVLKDTTSLALRQEIFDRVNTSSVRAKGAEVRRGAFQGVLMDLATECANDPLFLSLCPLSQNAIARRENEELTIRFFAYSDRYMTFKHDVEKFLNAYVKELCNTEEIPILKRNFKRMLKFISTYFPNGFADGNKKNTPRVRFEAISVGVHLALEEDEHLIPSNVEKWLMSEEFIKHTTTHASNSRPRLKGRIEFVRDSLLNK